MKLHLGCNDDLKPGYLNVDMTPLPQGWRDTGIDYQQADLNEPWPWETSSVDEILALEVFEHILDCQHVGAMICPICYGSADSKPARRRGRASSCAICGCMPCMCVLRNFYGQIHVMNEAHLVLKPGGILNFTVPSADLMHGAVNVGAFADPTHRSFWTWDDCFYFGERWNTPDMERGRLGPAYGVTALFRFPPMEDRGAKGWRVQPGYAGPLMWQLEQANGRAKLRARIEAVK